jgi:hypothetical protein
MNAFFESRWRFPLAWFVLSLLLLVCSYVQLPFAHFYWHWLLRALAASVFLYACWKIWRPSTALILEPEKIRIKGVRPGWWKFFQRWTNVEVREEDIIDIRIGRIREPWIFGIRLPPLEEPSKSSSSQSFLWIRYKSGEVQREIYYPDIYDIQDTKLLVSQLKQRFGDKVTVF